ncbi:hypothetical protein LB504_010169 [Fusarium proliferatum]|nr:hypothetical protein LB504_010169 [Fusarium proliferatum]
MWPVIHDFENANYHNPYKTSHKTSVKLLLRIRDSSRMQIRWTNGSHMRPKGQANKGRQGDSEILSNHLSPFGLRDLVI